MSSQKEELQFNIALAKVMIFLCAVACFLGVLTSFIIGEIRLGLLCGFFACVVLGIGYFLYMLDCKDKLDREEKS